MNRPRVVIIGSGFGGVYTVRYLLKAVERGELNITIVNRNNYFLFTPLLHEVATGGLTPLSVIEPLREIFRHRGIHFCQSEVKSIDPDKKLVATSKITLPYDYLVVATGAETNYYDTAGAKRYGLAVKTLADALAIRNRILDTAEEASLIEDKAEQRRKLSFVIVGGGATGVEFAGEVAEFIKQTICSYYRHAGFSGDDVTVTLISSSKDLIPQFPPNTRHDVQVTLAQKGVIIKNETKVTEVTEGYVLLNNGQKLPASIVIWVAGVKPAPIKIPDLAYDEQGRVVVDEFLRSTRAKNIFALGDVASFKRDLNKKALPMLAQIAKRQSKTVAKNICYSIRGEKLTEYRPKIMGMLISVGQWYGAGVILGFEFRGRFMWWLWRTVYLFNFLSWRKRFRIAVEWTIDLFYPRDISKIN